jgi:hypothetical protein
MIDFGSFCDRQSFDRHFSKMLNREVKKTAPPLRLSKAGVGQTKA